mmetsp:Transcript_32126/g.75438  ORF Transcript_32126/g.75438 Transcript_32126/m.75438 type:complete len:847 (-) Transcript_32126:49-2589(-)
MHLKSRAAVTLRWFLVLHVLGVLTLRIAPPTKPRHDAQEELVIRDDANFITEVIEQWRCRWEAGVQDRLASTHSQDTAARSVKSSAESWLKESCQRRVLTANTSQVAHLEDVLRSNFSCLAEALSSDLERACGCGGQAAKACSLVRRVPLGQDLKDFLEAHVEVAAAYQAAASLKGEAACASLGGLRAIGSRWLGAQLDLMLTIAAPTWIAAWTARNLASLESGDAAASNTQVEGMSASDMQQLSRGVSDRAEPGFMRNWPNHSFEELATALVREAMEEQLQPVVTPACVDALQVCGRGRGCADVVSSLWQKPAAEALSHLLASCHDGTSSFLAALNVTASCHGPISMKEMKEVLSELQAADASALCAKASQVVAKHLPNQSPTIAEEEEEATADQPSLAPGCSQARTQCQENPQCARAVEAMEKQSTFKGMLNEALGICSSKQSVVLALHVSAECPGLIPQHEAVRCRDAIAAEPQEVLCQKMAQLAFVLGELLAAEASLPGHGGSSAKYAHLLQVWDSTASRARATPSRRCSQALRKCDGISSCNTSRAVLERGTVESIGAALQLCPAGVEAVLSALDVQAACGHSSLTKEAGVAVADLRNQVAALSKTTSSTCEGVWKAVTKLDTAALLAESMQSSKCIAAQMRCGADSRCSFVASALSITISRSAEGSSYSVAGGDTMSMTSLVLELCEHREAMMKAVEVGVSCAGPFQRVGLSALADAVEAVEGDDVCQQLADPSRRVVQQSARKWRSSEVVAHSRAAVEEVVVPKLAQRMADKMAAAVDIVPKDGRLNKLELYTLARWTSSSQSRLEGASPHDLLTPLDDASGLVQRRLQPDLMKIVQAL